MSIEVTIPSICPVPGFVIGSLLNLFLTIISAASFMVASVVLLPLFFWRCS